MAVQDELIEGFLGAGVYLFTVPMYNLTVPVRVPGMAGPDHDRRPHPELRRAPPLTTGRPAVLISARGGYGSGASKHGMDHLVPALESVLGDPANLYLTVTTVTPELTPVY